eukprot:15461482-Alexandrium_andersonii.AAC.1
MLSHGGIVTMSSVLRKAVDSSIPLDDIAQAGIVLPDPDMLRARAADTHENNVAAKERASMVEAGRRALYAEPLPVAGGAPPCSNDGPERDVLDAAAAAAATCPPPVATRPRPSAAPRQTPKPTAAVLGAYTQSGSGTPTSRGPQHTRAPTCKGERPSPYTARPFRAAERMPPRAAVDPPRSNKQAPPPQQPPRAGHRGGRWVRPSAPTSSPAAP